MPKFLVVEHLPQLKFNFGANSESQNHPKEIGRFEPDEDKTPTLGMWLARVQRLDDTPFLFVFPV
jgi:hypothetical protein